MVAEVPKEPPEKAVVATGGLAETGEATPPRHPPLGLLWVGCANSMVGLTSRSTSTCRSAGVFAGSAAAI